MLKFFYFRYLAFIFTGLAFSSSTFACSGSLHIQIEQSGIYALDYNAIIQEQPQLAGCNSADLALKSANKEVAIRVIDGGDGKLNEGDRIEWVGKQLHGPMSWFNTYSTTNVYFLSASAGNHLRMREIHPPTKAFVSPLKRFLHLEQENMMARLNSQLVKPGEEPDVWFWAKMTHVDPQPFELIFDLPDLAQRGQTLQATLNFRGMSDMYRRGNQSKPDDHTVEITLNGKPLTTLGWDGREEVRKIITIPVKELKEKANKLGMRVPKRPAPGDTTNHIVDVVMFNYIEVEYPAKGNTIENNLPLAVESQNSNSSFELEHSGTDEIMVYGENGHYFVAHSAGKQNWRFGEADPDEKIYAATATNLWKPKQLRAVASNDWRKANPGYDYLIISHSRLINAIQPLAEFHRSRGLKVAVIDVDEVYDQFNAGVTHPVAIRNLIDYGYQHWQQKPRFVLLVGDASFDIRHEQIDGIKLAKWVDRELLAPNQFGSIPATPYKNRPKDLPNRNLIPTWQYPSPEGQSASDNWFVAIKKDKFHPVIGIGRFPVVEPEEVTAIVKKTIEYFNKPQLGNWRREVTFITDESEYFKTASDQIATQLGAEGFAANKVYASKEEKDNLAHQANIKDHLNDGQLLVHFLGHGGRFIWRTGPPDLRKNHDLFTLDDVSSLNNGSRLPMVLSMTCYSAPFDDPNEDSIGERFLREADKGAIAVFAASWRNSPQPEYSKNLIKELLKPGMTVGDAIVTTKSKISDRLFVETYNLLGDPALVLQRPGKSIEGKTIKLVRESARWETFVAVQVPVDTFQGNVHVDWLDEKGQMLEQRQYRAYQPTFRLSPSAAISNPAEVRVYIADSAKGYDAVSKLRLIPEIKPEPPKTAAVSAPKASTPQAPPLPSKPASPVANAPITSNKEDKIASMGFEKNSATAGAAKAVNP